MAKIKPLWDEELCIWDLLFVKNEALYLIPTRLHFTEYRLRQSKKRFLRLNYGEWLTLPPSLKEVHPNKIEYERRYKSQTLEEDGPHRELLNGLLISTSMELKPLTLRFPSVWDYSFRPDDPSNNLRWVYVGTGKEAEMVLPVEQHRGWSLLLRHLETGHPQALQALSIVKQLFGRYWQTLSEIEANYRLQVSKLLLLPEYSEDQIDDGKFYRSILSEVDCETSDISEDNYEVRDHIDGVSVVGLVKTLNRESALAWMRRHLE